MIKGLKRDGYKTAYEVAEFVCDSASDLGSLPTLTQKSADGKYMPCAAGSVAKVLDEKSIYILNNNSQWTLFKIVGGGGSPSPTPTPVPQSDISFSLDDDDSSILITYTDPDTGDEVTEKLVKNSTIEEILDDIEALNDTWEEAIENKEQGGGGGGEGGISSDTIETIWYGTQAEYDEIDPKDSATLYLIEGDVSTASISDIRSYIGID